METKFSGGGYGRGLKEALMQVWERNMYEKGGTWPLTMAEIRTMLAKDGEYSDLAGNFKNKHSYYEALRHAVQSLVDEGQLVIVPGGEPRYIHKDEYAPYVEDLKRGAEAEERREKALEEASSRLNGIFSVAGLDAEYERRYGKGGEK